MKQKMIGEGAYGCVHKPSLHCSHASLHNFNYSSYVSKLMTTAHAQTELAEFVVIGNLDKKNEYHLGKPFLCKPVLDKDAIKAIKPCEHVTLKAVEANPTNYSLLLLKYGGPDLKIFNEKMNNDLWIKPNGKNNREKVDNFWLGIHDLFRGLIFFKKNGLVHNDLKPQNILFNPTTSKFKFIDFGIMSTKEKLKIESSTSQNSMAVFHWSFPFDCAYMNKSQYTSFKYMSDKRQDDVNQKLIDLILLDGPETITLPPIRKPKSFEILFAYLQESGRVPKDMTAYGYIDSFYLGLKNMVKDHSYEHNLDIFIDSIDVFGLGFTLQFMANSFKRNGAIELNDWVSMYDLFRKMWDFNPETRVIDLELLITEYETLLRQMGVLTRLKKSFVDHKVVPVLKNEEPIVQLLRGREHALSPELEAYADQDVLRIVPPIQCPENKVFNPLTKRCVKAKTAKIAKVAKVKEPKVLKVKEPKVLKVKEPKVLKACLENQERNPESQRCVSKCKAGFLRNEKFKCVKVKTAKVVKVKAIKVPKVKTVKVLKACLENQDRNPTSNRCVSKCKPGFVRDDKFKCVAVKTAKVPKVLIAPPIQCPENQERNPITKRCVANCKANFIRDHNFKCKKTKKLLPTANVNWWQKL
jgi:serine/threonine protein kinase